MLKLLKRHRVTRVTIIRHEGALGFAQTKQLQETYTTEAGEILSGMQVALASRAAEELFLGGKYNGVYSDLIQASQAAAAYIGLLGMNGSFYSVAAFGSNPGDAGMKKEIEKLLGVQFVKVKQLLDENRDLVVAIAETLLDRLELTTDDLYAIMEEVERRKRLGEYLPISPRQGEPLNILELLPGVGATSAAFEEPPKR